MSELGDSGAGERRRRLLGVKLTALVAEHLGRTAEDLADTDVVDVGAGAALVVDAEHVPAAWVIIDGPAARRLGAALAWAIRNDASSLDLVVERDGGVLARRAAAFDFPIRVWFAEERSLLPVVAEAPATVPAVPDGHRELTTMIEAAGAVPHIERGVVTGEVRGLEVCRVVDEPTTGNFAELSDVPSAASVAPDDAELAARLARREQRGVILEVGVGANDREAFQMLHGHLPTTEALAGVVAAVTEQRSSLTVQHPLNRMAQERFLRWRVEQDPALLGLRDLAPVDPPVDRMSMKHAEPCVAVGADEDGRRVTVIFTVGIDVDLVAFVADVIVQSGDDIDRVIVAAPPRDLAPITADLVSLLRRSVELVGLD